MSNGSRRLMNVVLVVSLTINLLLIGAIVGRFMARPPGHAMPGHLGWVTRHIDENKRSELRGELEEHARRVAPLRRDMRTAQREFEAALSSPEFDEARLGESLQKLRAASEAYQHATHDELVEIVKQLDPADRIQVVRFLHRAEPPRGGRRRDESPGDP